MNDPTQDATEEQAHTTPLPSSPRNVPQRHLVAVAEFIVSQFWWIVAGAALLKLLCYFVAPSQNLTTGGHFARLLKGFVSYTGILALIAYVLSKCMATRRTIHSTIHHLPCDPSGIPFVCLHSHSHEGMGVHPDDFKSNRR